MVKQIIPDEAIRQVLRERLWVKIESSSNLDCGDVIDEFIRKIDISTLEEIVRSL